MIDLRNLSTVAILLLFIVLPNFYQPFRNIVFESKMNVWNKWS